MTQNDVMCKGRIGSCQLKRNWKTRKNVTRDCHRSKSTESSELEVDERTVFYDNDQPVLLPTEHIISKLVVKDAGYHIRHAGRESTLCETRRSILLLEEETRLNKLSRTA